MTLIPRLFPIYLVFAHMRLVNATCPVTLGNIPRMNTRVRDALTSFIDIQPSRLRWMNSLKNLKNLWQRHIQPLNLKMPVWVSIIWKYKRGNWRAWENRLLSPLSMWSKRTVAWCVVVGLVRLLHCVGFMSGNSFFQIRAIYKSAIFNFVIVI